MRHLGVCELVCKIALQPDLAGDVPDEHLATTRETFISAAMQTCWSAVFASPM